MPKSILHRAVHRAFPQDSNYWFAVKMLMEKQISPTITHKEGDDTVVYFQRHVLVGNDNQICSDPRSQDSARTTFVLNMKEPKGKGPVPCHAVIDLWDNITSISPSERILVLEHMLDRANPDHVAMIESLQQYDYGLVTEQLYAQYRVLQFVSGNFIDHGSQCRQAPPKRANDYGQNLGALDATTPRVLA